MAELHDAFTILEIAESEHVGFFKKGEGGKAALAGKTGLGGQIPINVSGGLKARGHPVGATGVAQVVDIVFQLRHELPKNRQVKNAENGLTVNFGGFGNNVLSFVLRRVPAMKGIAITAYKCKKCGKLHYPFHDRCLACKGREFETVKPQGNAKLLTFTRIYQLALGLRPALSDDRGGRIRERCARHGTDQGR